MKYQLVLQWSSKCGQDDLEKLMKLEELLIQHLKGDQEVDGHDIGLGEVNIFIHTNNPQLSFEETKALVQDHEIWKSCRAAFRELGDNEFTILWPKSLTKFSIA